MRKLANITLAGLDGPSLTTRCRLGVLVGAVCVASMVALASPGYAVQQGAISASDSAAQTVPANPIWRADIAAQRAMQEKRGGAGADTEAFWRALNWWGGTGVIVFAALLWLGGRAFGMPVISRIGLRGAEGIAIASALSGIVKGLAGRSRPFLAPGEPWQWDFNHGWSDARYFSMPSGHTTATVAFAVAAAIAAGRARRAGGAVFGAIVIVSALCVGFARMYADQHWLSDIAVAVLLGSATSVALDGIHARRPAIGYHRIMLGASAPTTSRNE